MGWGPEARLTPQAHPAHVFQRSAVCPGREGKGGRETASVVIGLEFFPRLSLPLPIGPERGSHRIADLDAELGPDAASHLGKGGGRAVREMRRSCGIATSDVPCDRLLGEAPREAQACLPFSCLVPLQPPSAAPTAPTLAPTSLPTSAPFSVSSSPRPVGLVP